MNKTNPRTIKVKSNLGKNAHAIFDAKAGDVPFSWSVSIGFLGVLFLLFSLYHKFMLPHPEDGEISNKDKNKGSYFEVFASFFRKEGIIEKSKPLPVYPNTFAPIIFEHSSTQAPHFIHLFASKIIKGCLLSIGYLCFVPL